MRELPIHTAMKRRVAFAVTLAVAALPWLFVLTMTGLRCLVLGTPFGETAAHVSRDLVTLSLSQALALGLVLFAVLQAERAPSYREALFLLPVPRVALLVALLAGLAMHFVITELANVIEVFVPRPIEVKLRFAALLSPKTFLEGLGLGFALIIVAPVGEELVFRGLVLPRLALRAGTIEAIVLTSMLFGASHGAGGPHAVVPATLAGLVLAYVSRAQRSVLPAIAMHAGSNALPLLLSPRLVRIPGLNIVREGPSHIAPAIVVTALLALVTALLYLARDSPGDADGRG